jgi:GDP-D-mannose dehydratase
MTRCALVTGGAGQDGWYLIEYLLARGYVIHAQSRRCRQEMTCTWSLCIGMSDL